MRDEALALVALGGIDAAVFVKAEVDHHAPPAAAGPARATSALQTPRASELSGTYRTRLRIRGSARRSRRKAGSVYLARGGGFLIWGFPSGRPREAAPSGSAKRPDR